MRLQARKVARELDRLRQDMRQSQGIGSLADCVFDWAACLDQCLLWLALPKRKPPKPLEPRKLAVKELDALCREIVWMRDGKCRRPNCMRGQLQWAHVYSRRYKWLRWDLDNSMILCAGHHLEWHERPLEAAEWWEKELGPERYRSLVQRAARPSKVNLVAVRAYLTEERKRYA